MVNEIWYPERTHSSEIQALLWYFLRKRKIDAHMEVSGSANDRGSWCKFDIVVFTDKKPVCIVECKSWSLQYSVLRKYKEASNTKQIKRYRALYGIPVFIVGRADSLDFVISKIETLLKTGQLNSLS